MSAKPKYKPTKNVRGCVNFYPKMTQYEPQYDCVNGTWQLKPGQRGSCNPKRARPGYDCYPPTGRYRMSAATKKSKTAGEKRPISGYLLFLNKETRDRIKAQNPTLKGVRQLAPVYAAAWKALGPEGQEAYKARAKAEMEQFKMAHPAAAKAAKGPVPEKLKPYLDFSQQYRAAHPDRKVPAVEIAAEWRKLHPKVGKSYEY